MKNILFIFLLTNFPIFVFGMEPISYYLCNTPEEKLRCAAAEGDLSMVKLLLKGGIDVDATDERGRTALMAAAWCNRHLVVSELLARGALINRLDKDGYPAISYANVSPESRELLIEKGANRQYERCNLGL